jgi:hypothetical protein
MPRWTHEGPTLPVLLVAGLLADEHELCRDRPFADHALCGAGIERTPVASLDGPVELGVRADGHEKRLPAPRFCERRSGNTNGMAPRPLWTGTLSFGLVTMPVRLHPAIAEHRLHFHLVHEPDESPIGYQKICKLEDKPVPDEEIVKAFEIRKGEYVHLSDHDFEAARAAGARSIEITDFVPYADIDPIMFARAYYVGPGEGGEHVYALLARAMADSGLAAIV